MATAAQIKATKEYVTTTFGKLTGNGGGWVYIPQLDRSFQGWEAVYNVLYRDIRSHYTKLLTSHNAFSEMVSLRESYVPTLRAPSTRGAWRYDALADCYDDFMLLMCYPQRAVRA